MCSQLRNWRDLLVRSLANRVERNIGSAVTRILVEYLLLQVYDSELATNDAFNYR